MYLVNSELFAEPSKERPLHQIALEKKRHCLFIDKRFWLVIWETLKWPLGYLINRKVAEINWLVKRKILIRNHWSANKSNLNDQRGHHKQKKLISRKKYLIEIFRAKP